MNHRDRTWSLHVLNGVEVVRCAALDRSGRFLHAFSTRTGGGSLGAGDHREAGAPDAGVIRFREQVVEAAGLGRRTPLLLEQVHGHRVVPTSEAHSHCRADGFLVSTSGKDDVAGIRTADCVPVLLVDSEAGVGAAVHAGWRGVAAGILARALEAMTGAGAEAGRIVAALGPGIGPCCFQVGAEVTKAIPGAETVRRSAGLFLDLASGIRAELAAFGLSSGHIHAAPWCTCCDAGRFFSYRRDGGSAGRMLSVLGIAGGSGSPP